MSSLAKSQLSKHISKNKANFKSSKLAKSNPQTNNRKIGEATATRMKQKMSDKKDKKRSKAMDEEIDSDIADDIEMDEDEGQKKGNGVQNDPFF